MSRKRRRERRPPPSRKPRHFPDSPRRSPGAPARFTRDYRTEEFIAALMQAEAGIYESFIISERELTDADVKRDLQRLIRDIREHGYPPEHGEEGEAQETMVIWSIRRRWDDLFQKQPRHSDEDLAGLLQVPLDSLEIWSTPEPDSRGYLYHLEGFLTAMGIRVRRLTEEGEEEEEEETEEVRLMALGRNWILQNNPAAGKAFRKRIEELLAAKQPGAVINACQYLIGYTNDEALIRRLSPFLTPAYRQLGVPFRAAR